MVVSDKASAEAERFELHDRREREGMQFSEPTPFVEEFRHSGALLGVEMRKDQIDSVDRFDLIDFIRHQPECQQSQYLQSCQ